MSEEELKQIEDGRFWLIDPKTGKKRKRLKKLPRTKSRIPAEKADESWLKRLNKGGAVKIEDVALRGMFKSSRKKNIDGIARRGKTRAKHR